MDIDSLLRRVYGSKKRGARFGPAKVGGYQLLLRGLSPLVPTISTSRAAPMIAAMRLRGSNAGSARGAASLLAQASKQSSPTSSTPPLAHLPSGHFDANAAWAVCAALAHNLLRAAGSLTSAFHAKARGATLRTHLVCVPTCPNTGPGPKTGSPCTATGPPSAV